jgi:hypothetical protein
VLFALVRRLVSIFAPIKGYGFYVFISRELICRHHIYSLVIGADVLEITCILPQPWRTNTWRVRELYIIVHNMRWCSELVRKRRGEDRCACWPTDWVWERENGHPKSHLSRAERVKWIHPLTLTRGSSSFELKLAAANSSSRTLFGAARVDWKIANKTATLNFKHAVVALHGN